MRSTGQAQSEVERYYDEVADRYDGLFQGARAQIENREVSRILRETIPAGGRMLEIGPGTGLIFELLRLAEQVSVDGEEPFKPFLPKFYLGVDISARMIDLAREARRKAGYTMSEFTFIQGDGFNPHVYGNAIRLPASGWDSVISLFGSPSYASLPDVTRILAHTLRPGGSFVLMPYAIGRERLEDYGTERRELAHIYEAEMWQLALEGSGMRVNIRGLTRFPSRVLSRVQLEVEPMVFHNPDKYQYLVITGERAE